MTGHYSKEELADMGLKELGHDVQIDRSCRIFGSNRISIGSNVRIDAFCLLSAGEGGIVIGNHVHLAAYASIAGSGRVFVGDFCGVSRTVSIFSSSDDYRNGHLTNPTVPDAFKQVSSGSVNLQKHVVIGAGSVVLPNVTIGLGASVGALTLVNKDVPEFFIVSGNPMRKIGDRNRLLLDLERRLLEKERIT